MLIQRAVLLDGSAADIRVDDRIVAVSARLTPLPGEQVFDADGGHRNPGSARPPRPSAFGGSRVDVGSGGSGRSAHPRRSGRVLGAADVGSDGWIRAVGYHEAVAGPLDRTVLDDVSPPVPVRVQHRSGVLWTLNSAGLAQVGLADHPDGRLRSADRVWSDTLQRNESGLAEVSRRLSAIRRNRRHRCHTGLRKSADVVKLVEAHRRR